MFSFSVGDGIFLFLFAAVYAMIEIEIEGPNGWAEFLPTPQKFLAHLSLYHVVMVCMASLVIGGLLYYRASSARAAAPAESPVKSALCHAGEYIFLLVIFFLAQDFLWFVLNPSYTVGRYAKSYIGWHKPWALGIPAFNFAGAAILAVVLGLHPERARLGATLVTCAAGVAAAVAASPLYHGFYRRSHKACFDADAPNKMCGRKISADPVACITTPK